MQQKAQEENRAFESECQFLNEVRYKGDSNSAMLLLILIVEEAK